MEGVKIEYFPEHQNVVLGESCYMKARVSREADGEPLGGLTLKFVSGENVQLKNTYALTNIGGEAICEFVVHGPISGGITAEII